MTNETTQQPVDNLIAMLQEIRSATPDGSILAIALEEAVNHIQTLQAERDALKLDQEDYFAFMEQVSKVYYCLTNGKFSKPNYDANVIIEEVNECQNRELDALKADLERVKAENEALRKDARRFRYICSKQGYSNIDWEQIEHDDVHAGLTNLVDAAMTTEEGDAEGN